MSSKDHFNGMIQTETKVLGQAQVSFGASRIGVDAHHRFIWRFDFGSSQQKRSVSTGGKNDIGPIDEFVGVVHTLASFRFDSSVLERFDDFFFGAFVNVMVIPANKSDIMTLLYNR